MESINHFFSSLISSACDMPRDRHIFCPPPSLKMENQKTIILTCDTFIVGRDKKFIRNSTTESYEIICKTFISLGTIRLKNFKVTADTIIASGTIKTTGDLELLAEERLLLINCETAWKTKGTFLPENHFPLKHTISRANYLRCISCANTIAEYILSIEELPPIDAAIDYLKKMFHESPPANAAPVLPDPNLHHLGAYSAPTRDHALIHFRLLHYFENGSNKAKLVQKITLIDSCTVFGNQAAITREFTELMLHPQFNTNVTPDFFECDDTIPLNQHVNSSKQLRRN